MKITVTTPIEVEINEAQIHDACDELTALRRINLVGHLLKSISDADIILLQENHRLTISDFMSNQTARFNRKWT